MTDDDKALVERLRDFVIAEDIDAAADGIEAQAAEIERLRGVLNTIGYDFSSGYLAVEIARKALEQST